MIEALLRFHRNLGNRFNFYHMKYQID